MFFGSGYNDGLFLQLRGKNDPSLAQVRLTVARVHANTEVLTDDATYVRCAL